MELSIIVLKSGITLVSLVEQMDYEPAVHMFRPHTFSGKTKIVLTPWPEQSTDEHVLINTDSLLTICEPTDVIRKVYEGKVKNAPKELTKESEPVILNEDNNLDDLIDDDYEPRYQET